MQANSGHKFCSHFSFWIWKVWKGREKLRKIWMSWKWKEIFRWNKKHFLLFLYTLKIFIWFAAPYMIALCIFTSLESLVRQLFVQVFSSHFNYSKSIQFQTFFRLLDGASKNVIQCIPNWKKIWFSFSCSRNIVREFSNKLHRKFFPFNMTNSSLLLYSLCTVILLRKSHQGQFGKKLAFHAEIGQIIPQFEVLSVSMLLLPCTLKTKKTYNSCLIL